MALCTNIRAAEPGESVTLTELAFRSKAHWGYSDAFMTSCREELTYDAMQIQNDEYGFAVLEQADTIVAFYALKRTARNTFELEALFVDPPFIGQGVGRQMMQHAIACVASLGGGKFLIQSDPDALGFYNAVGARQVGVRESGSIPGRFLPLLELTVAAGDQTRE